MPSIVDVATQLHKFNVPILIPDTCILLDIIRSTHRELADYASHAVRLLELLTTSPPGCGLVVASIVPLEWGNNVDEVTDESERHYKKITAQSGHFHDACHALGIPLAFGRSNYATLGFEKTLRDLSKQVLDQAICLDGDTQTKANAMNRVVYNLPPARKGSQAQDCTITEETLELCRRLSALGFPRKKVFCTSNTNDYCNGKKLHPNLATEFTAAGITFTNNLGWAMYELTH